MGSLFQGKENKPPEIAPGFEFLTNLLEQFGPQVQQQLGGIFNASFDQSGQSQLQNALGGFGSQGAFQEGLATGFFPDVLQQVEGQLLPALERASDRGFGAIKENAASLGTLTSSGTGQQFADFRGGLESNLGQQLAGISGQLAGNAQNIRGGLAGQGIASILPAIQTSLQQSQFGQTLPLQALGALVGGSNAVPVFNPSFGPSKVSQLPKSAGAPSGGGNRDQRGPSSAPVTATAAGGSGAFSATGGQFAGFNPGASGSVAK